MYTDYWVEPAVVDIAADMASGIQYTLAAEVVGEAGRSRTAAPVEVADIVVGEGIRRGTWGSHTAAAGAEEEVDNCSRTEPIVEGNWDSPAAEEAVDMAACCSRNTRCNCNLDWECQF